MIENPQSVFGIDVTNLTADTEVIMKDFLETTDYGGYVDFQAGTHNDYFWKEWRDKINREIAEQFALGLKVLSQPTAPIPASSQ